MACVFDIEPAELEAFWGAEAPSDDENWDAAAAAVIQQAEDLLYLVTGIEDLPEDERQLRMVRYAVMDMAILLYVGDPSEAYSPYSSERIGSYSYTLKQNAAQGKTGAFWWDTVVSAIRDGDWDATYSLIVSGEQVFHTGFSYMYRSERLLHRSPVVSTPGAFEVASLVDPSEGADRWLPNGSTSDGSWAYDPYD